MSEKGKHCDYLQCKSVGAVMGKRNYPSSLKCYILPGMNDTQGMANTVLFLFQYILSVYYPGIPKYTCFKKDLLSRYVLKCSLFSKCFEFAMNLLSDSRVTKDLGRKKFAQMHNGNGLQWITCTCF